ncbi:MAG: AIPR family protein [Crinalium sp.]
MVKIQISRIKRKLDSQLTSFIDMSDFANKSEEEKQKACLSRSYAAYSLVSLASAKEEEAAQAIVDGFKDNGIDAIYYEEEKNILWLVQAKWFESGNGEPGAAEVGKFIKGIKDIINMKFAKFNEKIRNKQGEVENLLSNHNVKIKIVLAYSGSKLGEANKNLLLEFVTEENIGGDFLFLEIFTLSEAYSALSQSITQSIDGDITLTDWGLNEEPYKTWYGQIGAEQLAKLWIQNKGNLFSQNIRSFVGMTDVNDGIQETLLNDPEAFLYLNNGVTVLCYKIKKTPSGGSTRSSGTFHCEGISIINGAQTVGTIGTTYEVEPEKVERAKVFIKLISLESCPSDFALKVTKATNTQNKVENRDFISLDDLHEDIQKEFALEGISYHYKRDQYNYPSDEKNCTLEEATIALACGLPDIRYTHIAKDKIGKLWEDVNKAPYTEIFNSDVSVKKMWRMIQIMRVVHRLLRNHEINDDKKATCIYGNRFILHMVFRYVEINASSLEQSNFDNYLNNGLGAITEQVIETILEAINTLYPNKSVYQIFRNLENYKCLKQKVLELLPLNDENTMFMQP